MNRREFCRNILGGAALLAFPLPALAKETPEERVQRLIDATPQGGKLVIPYGIYQDPRWVIRRSITLDLNGSTIVSQKGLYFVSIHCAGPIVRGAITVMKNASVTICHGNFRFSNE